MPHVEPLTVSMTLLATGLVALCLVDLLKRRRN
jgi:hypothetical protein